MRWNELGKFLIIALAIIGGFCVYISPLTNSIKQGLDLQGGTHVVLQAVDTPELKVDDDAVNRSVKIIERRVNELGLTEPVIQRQGKDRIIVELPGVKDPEKEQESTVNLAIVAGNCPEYIFAHSKNGSFRKIPYLSNKLEVLSDIY